MVELSCLCEDWKESQQQIQFAQDLAFIHGYPYTGKAFHFCPWCGQKLSTARYVTPEDVIKRLKLSALGAA